MYVDLDKKVQRKLLKNAIAKAGSERKLGKIIEIPTGSMYEYKKRRRFPYNRFKKLFDFLELSESNFRFKLIDQKEFRIKGGIAVQKKYLKENRFNEIHIKMRRASSKYMKKYMKNWHANMKKQNPEAYYNLQHARFKSIGGYKFVAEKGHFVRNKFELEIANILHSISADYEYEPMVKIPLRTMFPDFKIGNLLLECTAWKGEQKAYTLLTKIKAFEEAGYSVRVVIPDKLRDFYKPIQKYILNPNELRSLFWPG